MTFELIEIKIDPERSFETICFTAFMLVNDKRAGIVKNDGIGSKNVYQFAQSSDQLLFAKFCKDLPLFESDWGPVRMDPDFYILNLIKEKKNEV